jgi:hypothetical protein
MKDLPQLDQQQLKEWREKILGRRSNKFPDSFLFEQLFFERSPLSRGKKLSDRIEGLAVKFKDANIFDGLIEIFPDILEYLKDNDFLDEAGYNKEYDKCMSLLSGKGL